MIKGGFNSSFIEIRTLEGDEFIKDLKRGDSILSTSGYSKVRNVHKRIFGQDEEVFNIYYHNSDREGVLDRVSGDQIVFSRPQDENVVREIQVKKLETGYILKSRGGEVIIDRIEKMETLNKYFYHIDIGRNNYYADDVCIKNMWALEN